jgi:membrane protein DedA with SNARE-associated domain
VTLLQRFAGALADSIATTGDFAPVVLFLASFVEYVVPPFPGDAVVVLGAWYAVQGEISWPVAFASVTGGAVAGAWIDYRIGASLGRRLDRRLSRRSPAAEERLARFEASYRRWGALLLLGNRFLPGVRAFIFYAAGASGVPLRKVLLLGAISSALWNVGLLAAGAFLARNVDELVLLLERYTRGALFAIGAAALVAVVIAWLRRRRAGRAGAGGR